MQVKRESELNNITFMKCILMLTVVAGHSLAFWNGSWFTHNPELSAPVLGIVYQWIGSFHIYGFVLASGYLFSYIRFERGGYQEYLPFVKNKAKRLLVPFLFVLIIWVLPITQLFFKYSLNDIVVRFFLATAPGQLWFLWMLFDIFILFWPLSTYVKEHKLGGALLSIAFYCAGTIGGLIFPNILQIWTALQYFVFFWIGFRIRQENTHVVYKVKPLYWIVIHLLLFIIHLIIPATNNLFKLLIFLNDFLLHITGACLAFSVLQLLGNSFHWRENKLFLFVSDRSMIVYLFHQQIIYLTLYWLNGKISPYIHAPINFIVAVFGSLVVSIFVMKINILRFLVGEKQLRQVKGEKHRSI